MSSTKIAVRVLAATLAIVGVSLRAEAQSVTYHLHAEASTTSGFKQLSTAVPDATQSALQTGALQGAATGEKQIAQFDTAATVSNTAGKIPTGATVSAVVWMRTTANFGTMFPRVKVRLNSSSGTSLCTATGTTALTTTLTPYTLTCTTTANVTLVSTDRLYLWAGVNLTVGSSGGAFRGELGIEGTLNGSTDSSVDIPTALPSPAITSFTPPAGPVGTVVTIAGSNFRDQQLTSVVKFFNNRTATVTNWSNTSIVVTVPASAVTGNVTVTVAGVASPGATFGVGNVPLITQVSPTVGPQGTSVVITGSNFGATKGSSSVTFNGVAAPTTTWSATSIATTVPAGATTGNVLVTVAGIASAGVPFTVPTLNSITVTPNLLTVPIAGVQQFRAIGHYSDGVDRNISTLVTWVSSDNSVATMTSTGLATVTASTGATMITATLGTAIGGANLTATRSRFRTVGSLRNKRLFHTSNLLPDGTVLVAGGQDGSGNVTATAERYDPTTGRFQPTGSMFRRRELHTATTLLDGRVLIVGGLAFHPDQFQATAELYDPSTGTFSNTGVMIAPRYSHTATLLSDGRVLIEGGQTGSAAASVAEIYDPATGEFTTTGSVFSTRSSQAATLMNDGRVLVSGGVDGSVLATTETWDAVTGLFTAGPSMIQPRATHTATRLLDGRVLVVGGISACPGACSAELLDPVTQAFTATTEVLSIGRNAHSATVLNDGTVLIVGGQANSVDTGTAEIFDPTSQTFRAAGSMLLTREGHTATKLQDGSVLIVGGFGQMSANTAELYSTTPITPASLVITPSSVTLEVGDTRGFTVVDQLAQARDDAAWSISNPGVATIDPDTGTLSAVAPGTATVTASIGSVTADAQITVVAAGSLPAGATRWTIVAPPGFTTTQVLQATGPDDQSPAAFSVNSTPTETVIQGLTADGRLLWQTGLPPGASNFVPNKSGGLLVTFYNSCDGVNPMRLVNIDGPTGMWAWDFVGATTCGNETPHIAVRPDGALAISTPGNVTGFPTFMLLSGTTGTPLSVPDIPASTFTSSNGQHTLGVSRVGPTTVDRDGAIQLLYEQRLVGFPPQVLNTGIWLMTVRTDGSFSTTQLSSTTANTNLFPGNIIPDGNGGLLATWIDSPVVSVSDPPAQSTLRAARISAAGAVTPYDLPLVPPVSLPMQPGSGLPVSPELTLGQSGRAFVSYADTLVAFNVADGGLIWQYQAASGSMTVIVSDTANGVLAKNTVDGVDTPFQFDAFGTQTTEAVTGVDVDYTRALGWIGLGTGAGAQSLAGRTIDVSSAGWSAPTQKGTKGAATLMKLVDARQDDPQQGVIKAVYLQAQTLLAADPTQSNHDCSDWFNTGFPIGTSLNTAADFLGVFVLPNRFAHADFTEGGSVVDGERIAAFTGDTNGDPDHTPVGAVADTAVSFNRKGAFFQSFFSLAFANPPRMHMEGQYRGGTVRAQLTIALHELAHLLEDTADPSVSKVPGYVHDGGDPTGQLSTNNNTLLLKKCHVMIERAQ